MKFALSVFSWLLAIALSVIVYLLAIWSIPPLEAKYLPVVSPVTLERVERVGEMQSRVWVRFTKMRECQPIGAYWYRGRRGGPFDQIGFVVEKPRPGGNFVNRPLGEQTAGPWLIDASPEELQTKVFADAQHSCFPGWVTISHFYR